MYLISYFTILALLLILIMLLNNNSLFSKSPFINNIITFFTSYGSDITLLTLVILTIIFYTHLAGWKFNSPTTSKSVHSIIFETFENNFCKTYKNNSSQLNDACKKLNKKNCLKTHCCLLLDNKNCVAGDKYGPTFRSLNKKNINFSSFCHKNNCKN